jgi:hypothetical protein
MQAPLSHPRLASGARRLSFFVALAVFCVLFWLPKPALAMLLPTYDLASLAWKSDAIVRAKRVSSRHLEPEGYDLVTYRVLKVYTGSLAVGDEVELADDYARSPLWGWGDDRPHPVSDEVIAFLEKRKERPHQPDSPFRWQIVLSGLRVLIDGQVQRFVQTNNPGTYHPVGQGPDPWDLMGDPRGDPPLDWEGFEKELGAALARVERVREALKGDLASPAGKAALLATLGPLPDDEAPTWNGDSGFYDDEVGRAVIQALAKAGDARAVLDGVARMRGSLWGVQAPADMLVAGAKDSKVPVALRRAALRGLDMRSFDVPAASRPALLALISDPEPEVRKAALEIGFLSEESAYRDLLKKRFAAETDSGAKVRLVEVASRMDLLGELVKGDYLLFHAERNRFLVEAKILYPQSARRTLDRIVIEAKKAGALAGRLSLEGDAIPGATGTADTQASVPLTFDPPLAAGTYDLEMSADIGGGDHVVTRRVALSPLKVVTPLLAPGEIKKMQEALPAGRRGCVGRDSRRGRAGGLDHGQRGPPGSERSALVVRMRAPGRRRGRRAGVGDRSAAVDRGRLARCPEKANNGLVTRPSASPGPRFS